MGAAELLLQLHSAGLTLEHRGQRVIVRPKSRLTDKQRDAIRTQKSELLALLVGSASAKSEEVPTTRSCNGCAHHARYRNCGQPVAAGLRTAEEGFGIAWSTERHSASCSAFTAMEPTAAADRQYRLASGTEAPCRTPDSADAEMPAVTACSELLAQVGSADANELVGSLALPEREGQGDAITTMSDEDEQYREEQIDDQFNPDAACPDENA